MKSLPDAHTQDEPRLAAGDTPAPQHKLLRAKNYANPADRTKSKDVFLLSIPMFVELFMQMSVGYVDQLMLAHLGTQPAAAVGNSIQVLNLVTIMLSAMATASTVLITRALGADQTHRINVICSVSLVVNIGVAALITVALFTLWPQLLALMNVHDDIYDMTALFLLMMGSTTLFQGIYFALTAILRSYARVSDVMVASVVMNVFNILGCLVLVNGYLGFPQMGLAGSATSSIIARFIGLGIVVVLFRRHTTAHVSLKYLRPWPSKTLKEMLGIGIPSSGEQFSYELSQLVILGFVNILGSIIVTVKVYCSMCASVAYVYSLAISQSTQIVMGYLFGQRKIPQIFHRTWLACGIAICVSVSVSVILYLNVDAIFNLVTTDPMVHDLARQILAIEIVLEVGRSLNIVLVRGLIGVGDVKTPVTVNIICSWLIAVGVGYYLGIYLDWGLVGIWWAMCADEWVRGIFFVIKFGLGKWKKNVHAAAQREDGQPDAALRCAEEPPAAANA